MLRSSWATASTCFRSRYWTSRLNDALEMGQLPPLVGSALVQRSLPPQPSRSSHSASCSEQASPAVSPVQLGMFGSSTTSLRQTGSPQVAYHFRSGGQSRSVQATAPLKQLQVLQSSPLGKLSPS